MFFKIVSLVVLVLVSFKCIDCSYWHSDSVKFVGNTIKRPYDEVDFCDKHVCVADASRMGLWMNYTRNPCENFYEFVCGAFLYNVSR